MVKEGFSKVTFEERLNGVGSGARGHAELASPDRGVARTGGGRRNEGRCGWSGALAPCEGDLKVRLSRGSKLGSVTVGLMLTSGPHLCPVGWVVWALPLLTKETKFQETPIRPKSQS